jgi:hypothetical protein
MYCSYRHPGDLRCICFALTQSYKNKSSCKTGRIYRSLRTRTQARAHTYTVRRCSNLLSNVLSCHRDSHCSRGSTQNLLGKWNKYSWVLNKRNPCFWEGHHFWCLLAPFWVLVLSFCSILCVQITHECPPFKHLSSENRIKSLGAMPRLCGAL